MVDLRANEEVGGFKERRMGLSFLNISHTFVTELG
jgi:hypothetical protein